MAMLLVVASSWFVVRQRAPQDTGRSREVDVGRADPEPLVDPDDIISGGPPRDGIPPIDKPRLEEVGAVDWLAPKEPVIELEIRGDARAYPLQIMVWHEIVNDEVGGTPVTVTFCPLCNTAYAFERPVVGGKVTTFGTSGKLYNSNLVMYDRATWSYWPQAMGQAVMGRLTGRVLDRLPAQIVSWEEFRTSFPNGRVLSRDTGFDRDYGENPYPGYDHVGNPPSLFTGELDERLAAVERILGVELGKDVVAFPYRRLQDVAVGKLAVVNATIGQRDVLVIWKKGTISALDRTRIAASRDVGAAAAFMRTHRGRTLSFEVSNGEVVDRQTRSVWNLFGEAIRGPLKGQSLREADYHDSFWFDWAAFHPDTKIWRG